MAAKQVTTVYCCQQVSYPQTIPDMSSETYEIEIPVQVLLSFYSWPRMMLLGINADEMAILGGWPIQPIAQA